MGAEGRGGMICDRCAALEERVAWLEGELGLRVDASQIQALCQAFGLSPGAAHLVRALHGGRGRAVTHLQLLEAIPSPDRLADRSLSNVNTLVCRARKGLGQDSIANVWGRGYRLTDVGMDRVSAILGEVTNG